MATLYDRIKSRRTELGLTVEDLANKMGYKDKSSISKIENGKADIPQSKIAAFAEALETTPAYLMGWESQSERLESEALLAKVHAAEEQDKLHIAAMIQDFNKLNDEGKTIAVERVHELTEIPRYQNVYAIAFEQYKSRDKE